MAGIGRAGSGLEGRAAIFETGRSGQVWFCVAERGGWSICYRLAAREGRVTVCEVRVVATPPDRVVYGTEAPLEERTPSGVDEPPEGGLTATILKDRLTLGRHVFEDLPRRLREIAARTASGSQVVGVLLGGMGLDMEHVSKRSRRGPKGEPAIYYARLAADYVDAYKAGSRSPALDVARARGMSPAALRAAIRRARNRHGLLTRHTTGRAGGELTPRAEELLKEHGRR